MPILESGGWRIDYLDEGQGPPVLLIHSATSNYKQWRPLMDVLAPHHRVLALNTFGYGQTSVWPDGRKQTLDDQLGLVFALMDLLPGKVSLVGHSMGAVLALEAALRRPEQVSKLALYEPNPIQLLRDNGRQQAWETMLELADMVRTLCRQGRAEEAARNFVEFWSDDVDWDALPEKRRANLTQAIRHTGHEADMLGANTTTLQTYAGLAMPVLLMYAKDTNHVIAQTQSILRDGCPRWEVYVQPEGGHMAPITHPEGVNAKILEFLA